MADLDIFASRLTIEDVEDFDAHTIVVGADPIGLSSIVESTNAEGLRGEQEEEEEDDDENIKILYIMISWLEVEKMILELAVMIHGSWFTFNVLNLWWWTWKFKYMMVWSL